LSQLPTQTVERWPWLVYTGGELAAAQGRITAAQHAFALASRLFTARHDSQSACQSLLAESTLAEWNGDHSRAEARALAANALAQTAGMPWYQIWAAWQLGCLSVATDDLDAALIYFSDAQTAAAAVGDALMLELPRQAEQLTLYQRELRRQGEFHRQSYVVAKQAEQVAAEQLRLLLSAPPACVDALLDAHGWPRLPLMLKLPAPISHAQIEAAPAHTSVLSKLLGLLGTRRTSEQLAPASQVRIENSVRTRRGEFVSISRPVVSQRPS
jgi:hypothetical protein